MTIVLLNISKESIKVLPSHIQEPLAGYCAVLLRVLVGVVDHLLDASLLTLTLII